MIYFVFQVSKKKIVPHKPVQSQQSDLADLGLEPDLRLPKV